MIGAGRNSEWARCSPHAEIDVADTDKSASKKQQRLAEATRMYRRTILGTARTQLTRAFWVTISGFVRTDRLLRYLRVSGALAVTSAP